MFNPFWIFAFTLSIVPLASTASVIILPVNAANGVIVLLVFAFTLSIVS